MNEGNKCIEVSGFYLSQFYLFLIEDFRYLKSDKQYLSTSILRTTWTTIITWFIGLSQGGT